jgi:hypothetical protein
MTMPMPDIRRARLAVALTLGLLAAAAAEGRAQTPDPWALCAGHAEAAARAKGLPQHLLGAIARVESGRWNRTQEAVIAWPWTVTAEGKGRYLPSRPAAVAAVQALKARGIANIDVGCMQVNLRHHPEAFASLEAAFDPARNTTYAAEFLARLRAQTGAWTTAIGRYHSRTPRLSGPYRLKVFRAWREARHQAEQARRPTHHASAAALGPNPAPRLAAGRRAPAPGQIAVRSAIAPALPLRR